MGHETLDFPATFAKIKNSPEHNLLVKLPTESWPTKHRELAEYLNNLDRNYAIEIDPDHIF